MVNARWFLRVCQVLGFFYLINRVGAFGERELGEERVCEFMRCACRGDTYRKNASLVEFEKAHMTRENQCYANRRCDFVSPDLRSRSQ